MVLGKGGAGGLVNALIKMIEAQNGAIHTGARVTSIVRTGRTANGIRLADGTTVTRPQSGDRQYRPGGIGPPAGRRIRR